MYSARFGSYQSNDNSVKLFKGHYTSTHYPIGEGFPEETGVEGPCEEHRSFGRHEALVRCLILTVRRMRNNFENDHWRISCLPGACLSWVIELWVYVVAKLAMINWSGIPNTVKAVAAVQFLFALLHFWYFYFISSSVTSDPALFFAPIALLKGMFALVIAHRLLSLREGWRLFVVIVAGIGIVVLPVYFLAAIFSSAFGSFLSTMSGISSLLIIQIFVAAGFLMFLFTFYALTRPNIKIVFSTRKQAQA